MEVKKNKSKLFIIIAIVVVLAIVGGVGGFFVHKSLNQKEYKKQSQLGDKYYESMQYNLAIVSYQQAIDVQPQEPEAYKSLANIYIEQERYTEAKTLLRKGLTKTKDKTFNDLIDRVNSLQYGIGEDDLTVQSLEEKSKDVKPKADVFKTVANATHKELMGKYKNCNAQKLSSEEWSVTYDNFDATVYYKNTGNSSDGPDENEQPERIQFSNVGVMFDGFQGLISFVKLNELFGKSVDMQYDDFLQTNVVFFYYKDCKLAMECDADGNVLSANAANYVESTILVESDDTSNISGKVRDYNTMNGVKANITFTCTDKKTTLDPITVASATSGKYAVDLPVGTYDVSVEADGYETGSFTLEIPEIKDQTNVFYDIQQKQSDAIGTITLEWEGDADLDLYVHCAGYDTAYYGNKDIKDENGRLIASLDKDARDGSQKETVTIYDEDIFYSICVQEYTQTMNIKDTGAVLTIAISGMATSTTPVPTNEDGPHWCAMSVRKSEAIAYSHGGVGYYDEAQQGLYKSKN